VEVLMALAHLNVVQLIEYFMKGPNLVLMLEYLPTNLAQVIQESSEKPLGEAKFKNWMLQILVKVVACHKASLFHGDLKPSNLLMATNGSLKIANFGMTKGQCLKMEPIGCHLT
jgi:serine/threonine protein kinase